MKIYRSADDKKHTHTQISNNTFLLWNNLEILCNEYIKMSENFARNNFVQVAQNISETMLKWYEMQVYVGVCVCLCCLGVDVIHGDY